jgi:hypothetical protein
MASHPAGVEDFLAADPGKHDESLRLIVEQLSSSQLSILDLVISRSCPLIM